MAVYRRHFCARRQRPAEAMVRVQISQFSGVRKDLPASRSVASISEVVTAVMCRVAGR